LLDEFVKPSYFFFSGTPFQERMQFIFKCGLLSRVEALAFKVWRDCISNMIHTAAFECNGDNTVILREIREKLAHFDSEHYRLKEMTSILELALWKSRMNEKHPQEEATHSQKKIKTDETSFRQQCRVTCGADIVIGHVLQFLVTV
jgi:hypothetical protein